MYIGLKPFRTYKRLWIVGYRGVVDPTLTLPLPSPLGYKTKKIR